MDKMTLAWICTVISCLGFGTNYIPAKKANIRDGNFFGLWLTVGIWLVGLVQWFAAGMYTFEPIAMLGGLLWAVGNLFVPFVIQRCGLGVGQLVWGATNMLMGWATGAFGLFGVYKAEIANYGLNYVGVALALAALALFTFMGKKDDEVSEVGEKLATDVEADGVAAASDAPKGASFIAGFLVALIVGAFFGSNFNPPTVLQQIGQKDVEEGRLPSHPTEATHYVFSHFTGILLFTCITFTVSKLTLKDCYVGVDVIVPGLIAGVLWGIAQVCWFNANAVLSFVVAFPIIVGIPGCIAAILGIVLFGENKDSRSLRILAIIIVVQAASLVCIATSHGA